MDPNNLAVNSVIHPYPISSFAEGARFYTVVLSTLEEVCPDGTASFHREAQSRVLANLGCASLWHWSDAHGRRWGSV